MKKILCLIDRLGFGGAERQIIGLAALLKQRGYYVDLLTYDEHDFTSDVIKSNEINVIKLQTKKNKWSKLIKVRKHLLHERYDAVIAYKDGPASISCLVKMMGGKFKLLVSERNTTQALSFQIKLKFFLYRFADFVIPNAQSQEVFIRNHFPHLAEKTVTITNYANTKLFCPDFQFKPNRPLYILTVGRIASQKNVQNYLRAVRKVKDQRIDAEFHWFGNVQPGEEEYGKQCFELVKELHLEGVVTFHRPSQRIEKEYQRCDVFCLPSLYEGYPNVVCEAMCCGKVILCSNVCDNPYIVVDGNNGFFFDPLDVDNIAQTIAKMCQLQDEERLIMGKRSREMAELKFSEESFVGKYIRLINY